MRSLFGLKRYQKRGRSAASKLHGCSETQGAILHACVPPTPPKLHLTIHPSAKRIDNKATKLTKLKSGSNKTANHHWWPRGLSANWRGSDGGVGILRSSGLVQRLASDKLGSITNAHRISATKDSFFKTEIETQFDAADSVIPAVIAEIASLTVYSQNKSVEGEDFLIPLSGFKHETELLSVLASLIVRSPMTRDFFARSFDAVFMFDEKPPPKTGLRHPIIAANQDGMLQATEQRLVSSSKVSLLIAPPNSEYCYGDGFYCTFRSREAKNLNPKAIIPLLPDLAVLVSCPSRYWREPKLSTYKMCVDEVELVNSITSVYAAKELFFRDIKPIPHKVFSDGAFAQLADENIEWIETLIELQATLSIKGTNSANNI
jgi:hypothetical protein